MAKFLILGAGFTARRVAQRLLDSGADVAVTNRKCAQIAGARSLALDVTDGQSVSTLRHFITPQTVILHSIPIHSGTQELVTFLRPLRPARIVYLSTTGVYGPTEVVNEHTRPNPESDKDKARMETEQTLSDGSWTTMVLRPAAIYGPGRGVHWSARQSGTQFPPANRVVSRIHVDDLAEHALRAMLTDATGAFPVADEEPCTSLEVAKWTFAYLGIPFSEDTQQEPKCGRRVDGTAVRNLFGIRLRYRSFREGVAACLRDENATGPRFRC